MREIFGTFGKLRSVELAIDKVVNLPRCVHCCWGHTLPLAVWGWVCQAESGPWTG